MTPEAFARYHEALEREREHPRQQGEARFVYSMQGYYRRSAFCRRGIHWACYGRRRGEDSRYRACWCPCHELDGRAYPVERKAG